MKSLKSKSNPKREFKLLTKFKESGIQNFRILGCLAWDAPFYKNDSEDEHYINGLDALFLYAMFVLREISDVNIEFF